MPTTTALNVLLLAQFYPPVIGGEERHVQALARGLAERGHRVTVATLRVPGAPESEIDRGVRIERLPGTMQRFGALYQSDRRLAAPLPDPETAIAMGRLISRVKPQLVHAHNWMVHSYLPFAVTRRRPLLLSLHDYGQVCAKKTLIYRDESLCSGPAFEKCLRCAGRHYGPMKGVATVAAVWSTAAAARALVDMFLPVSTAVADGNRLKDDRLPHRVVPNFIPDELPDGVADPEVLAGLPSEGYLLFVGAFARRKGVEVLLDAYRRLAHAPPLVMIGYRSSDDIPALDALPANVLTFTEWPADAVAEAWRRSRMGIVPSTWGDPCPTVVIEAMAAGKAVIGTRIGGMVDLVKDGETGILVPPADAGALARAIERLMLDQDRLKQMGAAAGTRSWKYRASAVVGRIEEAYRELIDRRSVQTPASEVEA